MNCSSCRFFDDRPQERLCRRKAPKALIKNDFMAYWPEVDPEIDWCGEYSAQQPLAHRQGGDSALEDGSDLEGSTTPE